MKIRFKFCSQSYKLSGRDTEMLTNSYKEGSAIELSVWPRFFIGKSLRILIEVHSHPSAIGSWNTFEPLGCPSTFLHEATWSFISISVSLFLPFLSLTYSDFFTLHKFFIITSQHNSFPHLWCLFMIFSWHF